MWIQASSRAFTPLTQLAMAFKISSTPGGVVETWLRLRNMFLQSFCDDRGEGRTRTPRRRRNPPTPVRVSRLRLWLATNCSQTHLRSSQRLSGAIQLQEPDDSALIGFASRLSVVFCELQFCKPVILILFTLGLQVFSKTIKSTQKKKPTKFAIDLRTPEEIEQDLKNELDTECWDFFSSKPIAIQVRCVTVR